MLNFKQKILSDLNKRTFFKSKEIPNSINIILANNKIIILKKRMLLGSTIFLNRSNRTKIKNRCLISGRSRAVDNSSKLSRIKFKEFSMVGLLPGVQRSSW